MRRLAAILQSLQSDMHGVASRRWGWLPGSIGWHAVRQGCAAGMSMAADTHMGWL